MCRARAKEAPRSSFIRFQAALPNECWQSDMTHWALRGDRGVEIVNVIDDHSRLCVGAVALRITKALDVVEIFENARQHYGTPASVLTDNGAIFTAKYRGGKAALEVELERLGVICKHSSPYLPRPAARSSAFTRP